MLKKKHFCGQPYDEGQIICTKCGKSIDRSLFSNKSRHEWITTVVAYVIVISLFVFGGIKLYKLLNAGSSKLISENVQSPGEIVSGGKDVGVGYSALEAQAKEEKKEEKRLISEGGELRRNSTIYVCGDTSIIYYSGMLKTSYANLENMNDYQFLAHWDHLESLNHVIDGRYIKYDYRGLHFELNTVTNKIYWQEYGATYEVTCHKIRPNWQNR